MIDPEHIFTPGEIECLPKWDDIPATLDSFATCLLNGDVDKSIIAFRVRPDDSQDIVKFRYAIEVKLNNVELLRYIAKDILNNSPRTVFVEFYVERHRLVSSRVVSDRPESADRVDTEKLTPPLIESNARGIVLKAKAKKSTQGKGVSI